MRSFNTLPAIAAMAATATALTTADIMKSFSPEKGAFARIVNRCPYPVHLWSVLDSIGCDTVGMVTLNPGETYNENYRQPVGATGVSIKISKTTQCKGNDITQLEYFLSNKGVVSNFLDVSYVDCLGGDCPTMKEGFYLQSGDQKGDFVKAAGNTICPVLSCTDPASCSKVAYVLPDDEQTRSCPQSQSLYFYMCGGNPPSADDSKPKPSSSSQDTSSKPASSSKAADNIKVNAAAVTPAPEIKEQPKAPKVKTEVVYVTKYEYVNQKRHAHAHARRHQNFHA